MCSDNPGSNAPLSNMSVGGAPILSVQIFPADDQFDVSHLTRCSTNKQTKVARIATR